MATLCLAAFSQPALANPTGASIASGQATITVPSATQLNIDQKTKIVIIDWKSFNIAAGETTKFNQPGSGALAVNRIGGGDPAKILGNLLANGRVILIDGNGILFGPNAKVNVGALLATTSDAKNEDILSGKATFDKAGNPNAQIVNNGTITATSGMVGLVAPAVANNGIIRAKLGQVTLGASNVFTVDFTGDGLISFPVDPNIVAGAIDANGKPVKALVANNGRIEGATVLLSARAAADLVTNVISTKSEIVAKSIGEKGGHIVLDAGGGGIALAGAKLDASGKNGGGSITVGSANAASVTVDKATVLDASATQSGNGGAIYVNSANTAFHGTAKAKGGSVSGDGGKIETSGHVLDVSGIAVDASAAHGAAGEWLLDPYNVTISTNSTSNDALSSGTYTSLSNDSVINVTDLQNALASSDVTITTGSGGSQAGDITVAAALTWSSSSKLTLDAYHSIEINAPITVSGAGKVALTTNDGGTGGDYAFLGGASLQFTGTEGAGQSLTVNGTAYALLYTAAEVQAVNSNLSGNFALAKPIDASSTTWNPIGTDGSGNLIGTGFTGVFEGLGNTISNVTVNEGLIASTAAGQYAGAFGEVLGTIRDLGVLNVDITGGFLTGGLAGHVGSSGSILRSYSTGTVKGVIDTGGLVGLSLGTLSEDYSTASVSAVDSADNSSITHTPFRAQFAGGLAGAVGGTITNVYATGNVTATSGGVATGIGGLLGANSAILTNAFSVGAVSAPSDATHVGAAIGRVNGGSSATNVYYNSDTSGVTDTATGVTGQTSAQLQAGPTGLNASPWSTDSGVYPYLNSQTPPTPPGNTIAGTVYSDYGVTALGNAHVVEAFLTGGSVIATGMSDGTTGAYSVSAPSSNGTLLLFLDNSNGKFADTVVDYSGSNLTGVNLYAGYLNFINTSAVSVSSVLSSLSSFVAPTGGYSASDFLFSVSSGNVTLGSGNGLAVNSSSATGFTVDQAFDLAGTNGLAVTTTAGGITVSNPVSLVAGNLTLNSSGAIAVNAPVTISGAGSVSLTAANDTTTFAGKSLLELNFGIGDSINYGATNNGGSLSINGTTYTLLYGMTDVQNISNSLAGKFALATSLDATSTLSWTPIGTSSTQFSGVFDGLGNAISNLTYTTAAQNAGLFGFVTGTVRNVGLVGGTVTGSHTFNLGSLVGTDQGLVYNSYSSASVSGTQGENGGLIGYINSAGRAANVFFTGKISGGSGGDAGGLAGELSGQLTNAFSTGAVSGSYAGGLVSLLSTTGKIANSYSTGSVVGTNTSGGLVSNSFGSGSITNGYWDTATSGVSATHGVSNVTNANGVTGLTTSGLQASLPGAWSTSVWGISAGTSYPYLKSFYPNGVTVITGTAYSDHTGATALAANKVGLLGNGANLGYAYTGANGYYYDFIPAGTLASGSQVLAYLSGNTTKGNTLFRNGGGSPVNGLDIYGGYLWLSGSAANLSSFGTSLSTALGSNSGSDFLFTLSGNVISLTSGANLEIVDTAASFSIDQAINTTGTVYLNMGGNTTQTASITAGGLALEGAHASFTLTNASNSVGTLADFNNTHTLNFVNSGALTIGTIGSDVGIAGFTTVSITAGGNLTVAASVSSTGTTTLKTTGNLTINSGKTVSGTGDVVLSATGNFVNNAGSSAVSSTGGRWLVYSANPSGDTFGNLDSTNTAVWNATYTSLPPSSVTATGNRYVFANQPTLTFTSTDLSKIYGTDGSAALSAAYTVSGLNAGVAHAYLADTAAVVFSGAPLLSSAGAATTATVEGGPYAINVTLGSLDVGSGYAVSFASNGKFTVNPATVTITYGVADATSTYGTLATLGAVTLTGVKTDDASNVSGVLSLYDSNNNAATLSATLNAGAYTEKVTSLTGSAASNYVIADTGNTNGTLTINPKALTVSLSGTVGKTYDGTRAATLADANYSLAGVVSGDTVVLNDPTSGSFDTKNAGTGKTVSVSGLSLLGTDAGNYTLSSSSVSGAVGTVTQAMLTASLSGTVGKTYDGTTAATLADANYSLAGVVSGDTVVLNDPTSGSYDTKNAGTGKTVSVSGIALTGADAANYMLTGSALSGAIGAITPASLNVTVNDASRVEGTPNPAFDVTLWGLVGGDTASVLSGLTVSTTATMDSLTGTYAIDSAGGTATNYIIAVRNDGTLTVTPRPTNGDVPGLNNSLPASNTNYNGTSTTPTGSTPSDDSGITGATGTLICDVSNSDSASEVCRATN